MTRVRPLRRAVWIIAIVVLALAALLWNYNRVARLFFPVTNRATIVQYAAENALDPRLVAAIIKIESDFRPSATSHSGALGLMQVMPDTGRWAAGKLGVTGVIPNILYDPSTNIRIGSWYLAQLQTMFGGRLVLILAAYNAGDHNVREWFPSDTSLVSDSKLVTGIPYPETRLFVRKVLFTYAVYQRLYDRNLDPK